MKKKKEGSLGHIPGGHVPGGHIPGGEPALPSGCLEAAENQFCLHRNVLGSLPLRPKAAQKQPRGPAFPTASSMDSFLQVGDRPNLVSRGKQRLVRKPANLPQSLGTDICPLTEGCPSYWPRATVLGHDRLQLDLAGLLPTPRTV